MIHLTQQIPVTWNLIIAYFNSLNLFLYDIKPQTQVIHNANMSFLCNLMPYYCINYFTSFIIHEFKQKQCVQLKNTNVYLCISETMTYLHTLGSPRGATIGVHISCEVTGHSLPLVTMSIQNLVILEAGLSLNPPNPFH